MSTLDKEAALPVDSDAISKCRKTTERVNCNFRNERIDTFTVDHLLSKLNSDSVKTKSCLSPLLSKLNSDSVKTKLCLSPIDGAGLPYFEKYLKPPEKKNVVCIPLCNGVHFQGYIVNIKEQKIIHIDSLRWKQESNLY